MSPNDDGATKSTEIGDALVTALGFEPTDGESARQAEISEQMSDGFTVTDVLDRDDDELDDELEDDVADDDELDSDDDPVDEIDDDLDEDDLDDDDEDDLADDELADDLDESDPADFDDVDDDVEDLDNDVVDESDIPDEASDVDDEADASIGAVDESDGDFLGDGDTDEDSDESASPPPAADSDDADSVIDAVVDSSETNSDSSNGVVANSDSTGLFGSRRGGFGRSGSDEDELLLASGLEDVTVDKASFDKASRGKTSSDKTDKVYADTAFPGVESDPDITLIPGSDSPAITGEHDVVQVDSEAPTVVQTRESVEGRGLVESVPSLGSITGWRPGGRRLQARKVRRVIRHIDPWSVLTFSVLFFLCLFAALLLASVLVWNVAEEAGTIENVENFILELGDYERFEIDGEDIFRAAVAIMGVFTLAASVLVVLLTVMFNLLSDLLGGIRITVIEEETIRVRPRKQLSQPSEQPELLE